MDIELRKLDDQPKKDEEKAISLGLKVFIMVVVCFFNIGYSYCLDITAALQDVIMLNLKISYLEYGVLNSVYSLPNIVFILVGGFLTDYVLRIRKAAILFSLLVMIGHGFFTLGAYVKQYPLMVLGRFLLGLGGESIFITSNKYLALWFSDSLLTFACSLQFCVIRASEALNLVYSHRLYEDLVIYLSKSDKTYLLTLALLPGVLATVVSVICTVIIGIIDYKKRESLPQSTELLAGVKRIPGFPKAFWLSCMCCLLFESGFFCFNFFAVDFFSKKYNLQPSKAGFIVSMGMVASIFAAPVIGAICFFVGRDLSTINITTLSYTLVQLIMTYTIFSPIVIKIISDIISVAFSSVIWPMVPYLIAKQDLGMAIAIMTCVTNIGLGVSPLIAGYVIESFGFFSFQTLIIISVSGTSLCS